MRHLTKHLTFGHTVIALAVYATLVATDARATVALPVEAGSVAVAGAVAGAAASSTVGVHQSQGQVQSQGNNQSVTHGAPRQAATAFAAPLTATFDTCMGSSSGGIQGPGFGLSIGSTWTDTNCQRLKNSRELRSMGFPAAALALVCQDLSVAEAMATAGTPCAVRESTRIHN